MVINNERVLEYISRIRECDIKGYDVELIRILTEFENEVRFNMELEIK